jgi:hypothetical protein
MRVSIFYQISLKSWRIIKKRNAIIIIWNIEKMAVISMLSQQEILDELSRNLELWKEKYGVEADRPVRFI